MITPTDPTMANLQASAQTSYAPPLPTYDPAATQFMAGGSMGYMPDAQFLTSSQYGAFRTMPQMGLPTQIQHQPSLWQSYLTANRGQPFVPIEYMINTYNPAVNQMRHMTMARRRVADAETMFGATAFDMVAPMAAGVGAAAAFGPLAGLAAGLALPAMGSAIADRTGYARTLQNMSMPRIIGGPDMSRALSQGFSKQAATSIDESIRATAADDLLFKESDYRKVLEMGSKAGLMDFSANAEQYKRMVKKLRDNFKVFGELMEVADLGELAAQMQRLMRMGAGVGQQQQVAQFENMFSRMTGMSHQDMVSTYGQQGALIFSQMGLTNYQGSTLNMANAARIEMMKRVGILDPAEIARRGGVSGMAQDQTTRMGQIEKNTMFSYLPYVASADMQSIDSERLNQVLSGEVNTLTAMQSGAGRLRNAEALSAYQGNQADLHRQVVDQLGPEGLRLLQHRRAQDLMKWSNLRGTDGMAAAYRMLGMDPESALQEAEAMSNPEMLRGLQDQLKYQKAKLQNEIKEDWRQERGLTRRAKKAFRNWSYETFEAPIGALMQDYSARQDYEENAAAGIYSTGAYGVSAGTQGLTEKRIQQLIGRGGTGDTYGETWQDTFYSWRDGEEGLTPGKAYQKMAGFTDLALKGLSIAEAGENYRMKDQALKAHGQSSEDRSAALSRLKELGLSSLEVEALTGDMDSGDISRKAMRKRISQAFQRKGLSADAARKKADAVLGDRVAMSGVYGTALNQNADLQKELSFEMSEKWGDVTRLGFDQVTDLEEDASDKIGELVKQGWFGTDNPEDSASLTALAGKSIQALFGASAETLLQEWRQAVQDGDAERATAAKKLLKGTLVREFGIDPDKVDGWLEAGDTASIRSAIRDQLTEKYGLSDDDVKQMQAIGRRRAENDMTSDEMWGFAAKTRQAAEATMRWSASGRGLDLRTTLKKALDRSGMGIGVDQLLRDQGQIRKLLSSGSIGDKSRGILQQALKQHEEGGGFSGNELVEASWGLLSDQVTETTTENMPARSEQEQRALDSLDVNIAALAQVLDRLNRTNQQMMTLMREGNAR